MHRFLKKTELRKQSEDENSLSKQTTNDIIPSLPTLSRSSLIMPTLTKRFSVLRRGDVTLDTTEKENDSTEVQVSDNSKIYNIHSSQLQTKSARSPLNNLVELREDESIHDFSIYSTSPNSVQTPLPTSPIITNDANQEMSNARKFYGTNVTGGFPIQQGSIHNPSNIKNTTDNLSYPNVNNNIHIDDSQDIMVEPLNAISTSNDQKIMKDFNEQNVNNVKDTKRRSGILENPTKDRPRPPRTRPPSLSPIKLSNKNLTNTLPTNSSDNSHSDLISRDSFQSLAPVISTFSPKQRSPTFNSFNLSDDDNDIHSLSRSPLDRLSDGLLRLSQSSSGKSLATPFSSPENEISPLQGSLLLSRESSTTDASNNYHYSDSNTIYVPSTTSTTSTTSIYHSDYNDYGNDEELQGDPLNNKLTHMISKQLTHPNSLSSINSFSDRDSNKLVQSSQHTNSVTSTYSNHHITSDQYKLGDDKSDQLPNDVNVRIGYAKQQAAPLYTDGNYAKPIMIQLGGKVSNASQTTDVSPQLPVKRTLRSAAPPKPQPPPLSLTDTLIASGQSDIAHQVMIMRRVQNANENLNSHNLPRKWTKSKNNTIKSISGPQLVSTSSNVKAVPIVTLGNDDEGKNAKFRRKFSLRETDTGLGKSLKKIKDVFISDNETNKSGLFGGKKQKHGTSTSQNFPTDNLPRKFISEENLNQRFNNAEKKGFDLGKRRAYSTRENRPNEALRQEIRNNFAHVMNEREQIISEYDMNHSSINNSVQNFTTSSDENITLENSYNRYPGSDSDIIEEPIIPRSNEPKKPPLYDIDALKRHAEMISQYSSNKREQSTSSNHSSQLVRTESISSSLDKKSSKDNIIGSAQDTITTNDEQECNHPPPSPYSPVSLISPFSDAPSGRGSPPPISPRNPLRNSSYEKRLQKKMLVKRNDSTGSNRSSVPMTYPSPTNENEDDSKNSKSKVIRRTIIITKPFLPPLPEDLSPGTNSSTPPSPGSVKFVSLVNRRLTKKKIIHLASDGRKWFLSKRGKDNNLDDENNKEKAERLSQQSSINTDDTSDTNNLAIPIPERSSLYRSPTPIPSPNTRDSVINAPYGIPIPPIPAPHRQSISSKRTSKSSTYSSNSKYRKSIGAKSNYSGYGESLYDCYDYSDHESADDEGEEENGSKRYKRDTDTVDPIQWNTIKDREFGDEDIIPNNMNGENVKDTVVSIDGNGELLDQHVEVLEMSDGSFLWQVAIPLEPEKNNDNVDLNDNSLVKSGSRYSHLDDYYDTSFPSPLHVPGVMPRGKLLENFMPSTSIYFANDIPLPKLLGEMTKGLGGVSLDNGNNNNYDYVGGVESGGTGIVTGMTVEEHLDQVMKALGVDEKEILY
ncbi:19698_t:CDS:2 [Cetraspora pellucida]|uniref:19698_t:CDS:1 n=1 Tax=Cetraspora pellucida TaxID=1433469 RepID=A0A9N9BE97_9GLOM|nr:19698_t:CDS:2 [Cetraspora pellucida]